MRHSTKIFIELYKRKVFDKIPVFEDETGVYYLSPKQLQAIQLLTDNSTKMLGVGGSARCFVGETLVNCIDGHKQIKDINEGDYVLSYNEIISIIEYKKVIKKYCFSLDSPTKFIAFDDINLKSLENHEYLFRGQWTKASELRERSLEKNRRDILSIKQWSIAADYKGCDSKKVEAREINENEINNSKLSDECCIVYDLEVEDNHSYTVTEENIIVHNCGKSLLLCFWQIMNRLSYPKTRGLIGRLELTNLDSTTGKTLYALLDFWGLEYKKDYNYDAQNHHKIIFSNESELFLMDTFFPMSDELFTKFGSLELTDAAVDESNETRLGVINKIYSRTGWCNNEKYGIPRKLLETFNPQKNHVYDRYWKPYRDNTESEERKFIKALPQDNPHPAINKWVDDLIKLGDKRMIERLILGNFDYENGDECLCSYDKFTNMFTNSFVPDEGNAFLTVDVAITSDRFVCFAWKGMRVKEIRSIKNVSKPISIITDSGTWINKVDFTPLIRNINEMCDTWKIPRANIGYDADGGLGAKMINFIPGAVGINNGHASLRLGYKNITTDLGYLLSDLINEDQIYFDCDITTELREQIITECQASLKRSSLIGDKLALKSKSEVSQLLGGLSPDLYDAFKFRCFFKITRRQ